MGIAMRHKLDMKEYIKVRKKINVTVMERKFQLKTVTK